MEVDKIICDNSEEIIKNYEDNSIDLIVTDIPYGINYKSNKQNCDTRREKTRYKDRPEYFGKIAGDLQIPVSWLRDAFRILKNNTAIYIFCHWSKWHILHPEVKKAGFKVKNMIVMNKSNHGMGDLKGSYAPKHELLLFATKGKHFLDFPIKRMNDIWDVPVAYSGAKRFHPNEKPISWLVPCIENSSKIGDITLDPFAGSGSTGVACKKLGRRYILIDVDDNYCKIAEERLK